MIPVAAWKPDLGPFSETSTDYVMNVTPIANGWAGFPDLSPISAALIAQAYGGCYFRSSTGSYGVVVGTATRLYRLDTSTVPYSWTDISGPSAPYAVPTGQMWQFIRFGTGLYACTLGAPLQFLDVDIGGSFADAAGSPPRSKYIAIIGDFIILGYLKVGATEYPSKWATCGLNAPTIWTVGTQLADEQVIPDGDEIMGLIGGVDGGRVFQRRAKRSLVLSADAAMPIKQHVIDPAFGVLAPLSIVSISGDDYAYLAEDGFQRGDGKTPIGAEIVNRFFFSDVDPAELETVQGVDDPYNHMVWWRYKSVSGAYKMIGWDWEMPERWTQADPDVQVLLKAVTPGVTLEGLNAVFLALYGSSSIDTPGAESFDSRRWAGGRPTFGAISSAGIASIFTGSNRAATIDTTAQALSGDVMQRHGITGAYLVSDTNSYTLAKAGGDKHGDVGTMAFGTPAGPNRIGLVPMRGDHRISRFRASIAAGVDWSFVHGVQPELVGAGKG